MEDRHTEPVLIVRHLKKYFKTGRKEILKAVDDVSFDLYKGETLGIVGESGCGKTTLGRTCIGLYGKTGGEVLFKGSDIHSLKGSAKKEFTKQAQIIFQDPYASLNPKMKVRDLIAEGMRAHRMYPAHSETEQKVKELLLTVGLSPEYTDRYVHEFSGGQRQRIVIARALAVKPEFIVCDEPISALDVSIQAQIVNLLKRLQKERNLSYLFIAHDLSMVRYISDRTAVMYLGKIVELAPSDVLYRNPKHPYTQALLPAVPIPDPEAERTRKRIKLNGELPSPVNPPSGCRFQNRCMYVREKCRVDEPALKEVKPGHFAACHFCE